MTLSPNKEVLMETMLRTHRKDALIIFLLLTFVFAYFYQEGKSNGNTRFSLIFAAVQERRLSIDDYFKKPDTKTIDHAYYKGHFYSDKAIGPAVIGAIFYLPLYGTQQAFNWPDTTTVKAILTFLVIGLPSAIAGTLIYLLCLYLSASRFQSFLTTLSITLGTMFFPFGVTFFSHQLTSSLLFSAFFMIFFLKEEPGLRKGWYFFLIGLLMGWALICEYPSVLIILALVIYYFSILWKNKDYRRWRYLILPFLGGVFPILLQMLNNDLSFGHVLSIGYANLDNQSFKAAMSQGVAGIKWPNLRILYYITLHPCAGLFWQSPVLFMAFFGAVYLFRQHRYRTEAILACFIICSYMVMLSGYTVWWGGASFGPRHLIPILPFFCFFLIFVPQRFKWPFMGLGLISFGQMLIVAASTVITSERWIRTIKLTSFFRYSTIYNYCLQQLSDGYFAGNLGHTLLNLNSWVSLIPFIVVLLGGILFFFRNEIKPSRTTPAA
jgi:hypothetical protein